jgi:PAS domain S-box-containing protein
LSVTAPVELPIAAHGLGVMLGAVTKVTGVGGRADTLDVRGLASRVPDVIYRLRVWPTLATDYVNEAVTRATGYTPDEFRANPRLSFEIIHPDDRLLLEEHVELGPTSSAPIVLRWRRKDGRIVWAEHREAAVRDQAGNLVAIEGVAREIPDPTQGAAASIRLLDGVRVDLAERAVHVDGRRIHLSPAQFTLLDALTERPGELVTRSELMRRLWPSPRPNGGHACESHISTLRRRIERDPRFPERIVTVRGRGYRYTTPAERPAGNLSKP